VEISDKKVVVEELKTQWKQLWWDRIDDKVRAEGIADKDYSTLFVEKGTVIFATRNFRMLNFREILEKRGVANVDMVVPPDPSVGGWGKFIRTAIAVQARKARSRRRAEYETFEKKRQQMKKDGRGWLHY